MNPDNDYIEIVARDNGRWDWLRKDKANGKVVSGSEEQGYEHKQDAIDAAAQLNQDLADDRPFIGE